MKYTVYLIVMLILLSGCSEDSPDAQPTPDPAPGKSFTNSIGMTLVYIPSGEFMMGSRDPADEVARKASPAKDGKNWDPKYFFDEHPQHRVVITKAFFMGSTEVTQAQYSAVMASNPSSSEGEDNPVDKVSWNDAVEFCRKLSEKEQRIYRLPTEAEWEYACRAGTTTPYNTGETISTDQARHSHYGNGIEWDPRNLTLPVGSFPPNGFGLYDMHGNVWEWCQDWYDENYYAASPVSDPQGPSSGQYHVFRGGCWIAVPTFCRSARRDRHAPVSRYGNYSTGGFRVVMDLNHDTNVRQEPHSQEQKADQDLNLADGNEHAHRFELLAAEKAEEISQGVFLVGWIRASLPESDSEVQRISVEMDEPDDYDRWVRYELAKNDINFDGYTDIGVHQYGGAKWGKIHWWLYDPEAKRFYRNSFTEELSRLTHANFWTDPKKRQIKISKFHGAEIKEYTYQLIEGHLNLVESTYIYQLVNGHLRLVGTRPSCPPIGRLSDGRDTCPVLYSQDQKAQQHVNVAGE